MPIKLFAINGNVQRNIPLHLNKFPCGESFHRIGEHDAASVEEYRIELIFEHTSELFELALLKDAIYRECLAQKTLPMPPIGLDIPYMPFARQDRVCTKGDPLAIVVVAELINSLKFDLILCTDLHSDVSAPLFNNLYEFKQHEYGKQLRERMTADGYGEIVLISPDAGARKKTDRMAKEMGVTHVVEAVKNRDMATGRITHTSVGRLPDGEQTLLICDDICDGGRTFVEIAKYLKDMIPKTRDIVLYVSHGMFTQGFDQLKEHFSHIYVAHNHAGADDSFVTTLKGL